MKTLKDFLEEGKKDNIHKDGTYVAVNLSKESTTKLYDWVKKNNISNPIDPHKKDNEYHVTVVYSRKGIAAAEEEDMGLPMNLKIVGWEIFNTQKGTKALVGKVDSKDLVSLHKMFREKYGATHDYDSYKPHLTISYDYGSDVKPKDVPDMELEFDSHKFQPLNPGYIPSNDKD